jgi:hypothetical protein
MNIQQIQGMTRDLGKPVDWDDSKGTCESLPIRDEMLGGYPVMISEWKPTADEVRKIVAGASVFLRIVGTSHPPVRVYIGEP